MFHLCIVMHLCSMLTDAMCVSIFPVANVWVSEFPTFLSVCYARVSLCDWRVCVRVFHVTCICVIRSAVYGVPFEGPNNWWIVFLSRDVIRFMYELLCESGDGDGASPCVINYLAFVCVRGMGSVVWLKLYVCGDEKVRCAVRDSYFWLNFHRTLLA